MLNAETYCLVLLSRSCSFASEKPIEIRNLTLVRGRSDSEVCIVTIY